MMNTSKSSNRFAFFRFKFLELELGSRGLNHKLLPVVALIGCNW